MKNSFLFIFSLILTACNSPNSLNEMSIQNILEKSERLDKIDSLRIYVHKTKDSTVVEIFVNQYLPNFCSYERYVLVENQLTYCLEDITGCNPYGQPFDTMAWVALYKIETDNVIPILKNTKDKIGNPGWHKDSIISQWKGRKTLLDSLNYDY